MKKIKKPPMKKARKRRQPRLATTLKDDIAKMLSDLGKLVFGTMVLGTIIRSGLSQETQLTAGIITATVFLIVSLILGVKKAKPEEPPSNRGGKTLRPPTFKIRRGKRSKR